MIEAIVFGSSVLGVALAVTTMLSVLSPSRLGRLEMREVPRTRIADAAERARVRVVGRVRPLDDEHVIAAPLTGRPCGRYVLRMLERERPSELDVAPLDRSVIVEERGVDFVVEDASGRAIVRTTRIDATIVRYEARTFDRAADVPPALVTIARAHGARFAHRAGIPWTLACEEGVLAIDEEVTVVGVARWEDEPARGDAAHARGYREPPRRKRLVLEGTITIALRVSDDAALLS